MNADFDKEKVRQAAEAIVRRAENDEAFKDQIRNDPNATLVAAGIPEAVIPDIFHPEQADQDVSGYMKRESGCNDFTCWTSGCPGSCPVSFCGAHGMTEFD